MCAEFTTAAKERGAAVIAQRIAHDTCRSTAPESCIAEAAGFEKEARPAHALTAVRILAFFCASHRYTEHVDAQSRFSHRSLLEYYSE